MTGAEPSGLDIEAALALYGIGGAGVSRLQGGMVNACYRVEAGSDIYVLKWYRLGLRESEPQRLAFVCETQERARANGLPAPAVIRTGEGGLFAETAAGRFVLSEFVGGRQYARGSMPPDCAYSMGITLHHLFNVLAPLEGGLLRRQIPSKDEALASAKRLITLIERITSPDHIDGAALAKLRRQQRGLEAWDKPVPSPTGSQWIHGDYQDTNLIFGDQGEVRAVIDWDNLTLGIRGYELMRAFNYSFPDGAASGLDFLRGYVDAARPTPKEASGFVDLWSYISLVRLWPVDIRYEHPELYQTRWDAFIMQPDRWWDSNKVRIHKLLVGFAGRFST